MRILCLHGYSQSASLFAKKSSGLRKKLSKAGHELVYIDGQMKIELSDLPFEPSPEMADQELRGWWSVKNGSPEYSQIGPALETVKKTFEEQGPFDGILGFSQGAGFTAILLKALPQLVPSHPALKFAVIVSGFRLAAEHHQHWYESSFTTPTLHVMGSLDTLVSNDKSEDLAKLWEPGKAEILKHPGGHYMPSQRPIIESIIAFIEKQKEGAAPAPEAKKDENWDEFDKIGK